MDYHEINGTARHANIHDNDTVNTDENYRSNITSGGGRLTAANFFKNRYSTM